MSEEITALLRDIATRLERLEADVAELKERTGGEVPEDVVMAISAAVAAFMGHRARVKAVRFHRQSAWTAQGRQSVQSRSVHHPR